MTTTKEKQTKKETTNKTPKRKLSTSAIILIVGCVLIAIPFIILGVILIQASFDTGKPIFGERFEGDLDPAITSADQDAIIVKCKGIQNVDDCSISLKTATLRLYVDTKDSITETEALKAADAAYESITSKLDVAEYFTSTGTKKMYDIEVHVYNSIDKVESEDYIYIIKNKSSNMTEPSSQVVSKALDEELAEQLRLDVEQRKQPKPSPQTDNKGGE